VAASLCDTIREYGREDDVLVASFRQTVIDAFRTACPEVATVAPMNETRTFYFLNVFRMSSLYEPRGQAFQVPENLGRLEIVTPHFVEKSHQHRVEVHVWTINEREKMQRLIDLGVDGIMTDYPDRLLKLLGRL
jgi:glycerophosphoryl diester phosphodiesterase